jgi:hypothetical protein
MAAADQIKRSVFWATTPSGPVKVNWRFRGQYRLHLQCWRIKPSIKSTWRKQQAEFGLFFNPEDRGNIFLQNFSWLLPDYTALYIRTQRTLYNHCSENLKSNLLCTKCTAGEGTTHHMTLPHCSRSSTCWKSHEHTLVWILIIWTPPTMEIESVPETLEFLNPHRCSWLPKMTSLQSLWKLQII